MLGLFKIRGGKMRSSPARLGKKNMPDNEFEIWIIKHANIFVPLALLILLILFVMLCYAICGVSATESGVVYNHFQDVI